LWLETKYATKFSSNALLILLKESCNAIGRPIVKNAYTLYFTFIKNEELSTA